MGKDGQPKHRQAARELLRRKAQRQPAERLLIVVLHLKDQSA
jgi:hypothetical protein